MKHPLTGILIPTAFALLGTAAVVLWAFPGRTVRLQTRLPGTDGAPRPQTPDGSQTAQPAKKRERPVPGQPVPGPGVASKIAGGWPWFRGPDLDIIGKDGTRLARTWPANGPKRLWQVELGDGYAAAAVSRGCVYVLDHMHDEKDADRSADTLRCLSLDDGREIWRNGYTAKLGWTHGYSRTVPAVVGDYVITLGPLCHVVGWDARTGKALWLIDLVLDYGTKVPEWYAGQCPLIDTKADRLILAPSGKALLIAVDYKTGKVLWESPNPEGWAMTHVSITPMEFAGRRMYVYCARQGVAGVDAATGGILWMTSEWQVPMATCPSPVPIGDGRIFLTGGYGGGSMMLRLEQQGERIVPKTLFTLGPKQFGCEQQTPVLFSGHLFGVRQSDKKLVCIDLDGNEVWSSGRDKFGSAPYMIADGLIYALNDKGLLTMAEASAAAYKPLARAQVIENGHDSWGPMALVAGRLIVRDMNRMVCLEVGL